jgi:DtxR family Mn-dependent transcriptional regulator
LIDRIDEMLGRPAVDPHGDPIPSAEGRLRPVDHADLLAAPQHVPLTVARVTDQDPGFLRFAERERLMPGDRVVIEQRDPEADSIQLRVDGGRQVTIGTRAASKVLVEGLSRPD